MQRDLVDRAMAGDHEAFSELARLVVRRLYVVARLILRDSDRAEDATQEALFVAWRDLRALRTRTASRPGCIGCWSESATARRVASVGAARSRVVSGPSPRWTTRAS